MWFASTSYQILRRIPVPSPAGIDITPDDSIVFIGTSTQAVYALNTATMAMTARYFTPPNPQFKSVQPPLAPVAAPDDTALISLSAEIMKWNPATGQANTVVTNPVTAFQYGPNARMAHSADHTKVIISNYQAPSSTVYVYDTQQNEFSPPLAVQGVAYSVAANPSGTRFAVAESLAGGSYIVLLDSNLNTIATVQGGGDLFFSADGSSIYVVCQYGTGALPAVAVLNSATLKLVGVAPSYASNIAYIQRLPPLIQETSLAVDETGRIFGSADHGLAIDDATDLRPYAGSESSPIYDIIANPDAGPVDGQQNVEIETQSYTSIPYVWFGPLEAPVTSLASPYLSTIAPALNQAGPVNVRIDGTDNVQAWIPQAYTYGTALLNGPDLAASSVGLSTVELFGYGLGTSDSGTTGVTASFGGVAGTISLSDLYPAKEAYPFPLWFMNVQTPSLPVGEADLSVTTGWGSASQHLAYHSLDIKSYPLDETPYSIAFDATRNKVYVAVTDHIDVFSLASQQFLSTIQVPTLDKMTQLGGIAITPDGKRLVVANWSDGSVAVIDPDNPSSATAVAVGTPPSSSEQLGPTYLAATNTGKVIISVFSKPLTFLPSDAGPSFTRSKTKRTVAAGSSSGPEASLWILDLQSMTVAPFTAISTPEGPYLASSSDGSEICLTGGYLVPTLYDSATGATSISGTEDTATCAVNGPLATSTSYSGLPLMFNLAMQLSSNASLTDFQNYALVTTAEPMNGMAVDPTGALVYQPWANDIALFDAHTGEIREMVALPSTLVDMFSGSILINESGDQIYVVTGAGLTVVQMDALPLAIGSITLSGNGWTISGTGFAAGTTLTVDGNLIPSQFIDPQHMQVSSSSNLSATHTLTLTNPDGHSYTYDSAYLR